MANDLVQNASIRNLEIIGEAVTKLSPALKGQHPDIPWSDISAIRNRLFHGYVTVNLDIVLTTVGKVLPVFFTQVKTILDGLGD